MLGMSCSQRGNGLFPRWEWFVPKVGMKKKPLASSKVSHVLWLRRTYSRSEKPKYIWTIGPILQHPNK